MHPYIHLAIAEQRTADMIAAAARSRLARAAKKGAATAGGSPRPAARHPRLVRGQHGGSQPAGQAAADRTSTVHRRQDELVPSASARAESDSASLCRAGH